MSANPTIPFNLRALAIKELRSRAALQVSSFPSYGDWLPEVRPDYVWTWPHVRLIINHLERVASGEIKKLMIFMPPRHGKSQVATIHFPVYMMERRPDIRVIVGAYSKALASSFSRQARRIAKARMKFADDERRMDEWATPSGASYVAVGVGSGITGKGGDLILIDDPVKSRAEANSEAYRAGVWEWYCNDLMTRREPGAAVVLIMTRWHEDDLAGRILASEDSPNWTVINLPALAETNDPLGRPAGAALCPERYDAAALESNRLLSPSTFQALYQQRPAAAEGELFKREWWRYYNPAVLPVFKRIIQSIDSAFKTKQESDFSVVGTWGDTGVGYFLIDCWRGRVEYPQLKRQATALYDKWRPSVVLIEDKASGQSLLQELRQETAIPLKPIQVDKDKISRAHAVTPLIEAGRVYLPETSPWLADFLDETASFPNAAHDDQVDAMTQALNYFRGSTHALLDFLIDENAKIAGQRAQAQVSHA
jgi:predicted phage terminase large subunit-like protein